MKLARDGSVVLPCCTTAISIEELAECIQEDEDESIQRGRLVIVCRVCSETVEIDLGESMD